MVPTALGEEQRLPWSGMDLCNVIQNKLVDEKGRVCIVGLYLDDTEQKLGYTCLDKTLSISSRDLS